MEILAQIRRRRAVPAALLLLLLATVPLPSEAEIIEEIAARVNDALIARSELQVRRQQIAAQLMQQAQGEELERRIEEAQDSALFNLINEELLVQQAELNFDMEKYFENLKKEFKQNNEITSDRELERLLQGEGMTMGEFRRILLRSNVPQDVLQFEVARKISVSPAEIEAYYQEDTSEFVRPGDVTLREIVVLEEPRGREAAQVLAEEIVARVAAGDDFGELARELSEAPSREKGGLVGPFRPGDLAPALEEQAFTLPVGDVGEPIATSYGFHIVKVETRTETELTPLAEVSDEIELEIRQQKYSTDVEAYLQGLWNDNLVIVNPRYAVGLLADGGPYATLEEILPAGTTLGAPNPAMAASSGSPTVPAASPGAGSDSSGAESPSGGQTEESGLPADPGAQPPASPRSQDEPPGTESQPRPAEEAPAAEDPATPEDGDEKPIGTLEPRFDPRETEPSPEPPPDGPESPDGSSGR
jgi:parvulin-like peptidyl-prolyl isomerase